MRTRRSARLVVLDAHNRILLFQYHDPVPLDPARPDLTDYWATPGGGVEPGETYVQTARRELWEETGIRDAAIGPWLWTRNKVLTFEDGPLRFHERYLLVCLPPPTPSSTSTSTSITSADASAAPANPPAISRANLLPHEHTLLCAHRWWTLPALRATADPMLPTGLPDLLAPILAGRLPPHPVTIDSR